MKLALTGATGFVGGRLLGGRYGVDVGGVGGERLLDALLAGIVRQVAQQAADTRRPA